ncbi:MAG: DUF6569 family protein [Bacteroidia bacterium]|nr:DUF6569 family protein [Bacteroidia bacterium]
MNTRIFSYSTCLLCLVFLFQACSIPLSNFSKEEEAHIYSDPVSSYLPAGEQAFQITESFTSDNLQIFLILGEEEGKLPEYLSLGEAMKNNQVEVKETGQVNELSITNKSDKHIFIHSGDIVKGGKQDRTLAYDLIVPPHVKDMPLASFCVEQGRWRKRGNESTDNFSENKRMLSSRELRLAAKYEKNQSSVWQSVAYQKEELSKKISEKKGEIVEVADGLSSSSLELALDNKELDSLRKEQKALYKDLLKKHPKALGYAYAINGEIYGIDIYNSHILFSQLWDKLLESVIVEAISKIDTSLAFTAIKKEEVDAFISATHTSELKTEKKQINPSTQFETTENEYRYILFSTEDKKQKNWVHRNYMRKAEAAPILPNQLRIQQATSMPPPEVLNRLRNRRIPIDTSLIDTTRQRP